MRCLGRSASDLLVSDDLLVNDHLLVLGDAAFPYLLLRDRAAGPLAEVARRADRLIACPHVGGERGRHVHPESPVGRWGHVGIGLRDFRREAVHAHENPRVVQLRHRAAQALHPVGVVGVEGVMADRAAPGAAAHHHLAEAAPLAQVNHLVGVLLAERQEPVALAGEGQEPRGRALLVVPRQPASHGQLLKDGVQFLRRAGHEGDRGALEPRAGRVLRRRRQLRHGAPPLRRALRLEVRRHEADGLMIVPGSRQSRPDVLGDRHGQGQQRHMARPRALDAFEAEENPVGLSLHRIHQPRVAAPEGEGEAPALLPMDPIGPVGSIRGARRCQRRALPLRAAVLARCLIGHAAPGRILADHHAEPRAIDHHFARRRGSRESKERKAGPNHPVPPESCPRAYHAARLPATHMPAEGARNLLRRQGAKPGAMLQAI